MSGVQGKRVSCLALHIWHQQFDTVSQKLNSRTDAALNRADPV